MGFQTKKRKKHKSLTDVTCFHIENIYFLPNSKTSTLKRQYITYTNLYKTSKKFKYLKVSKKGDVYNSDSEVLKINLDF